MSFEVALVRPTVDAGDGWPAMPALRRVTSPAKGELAECGGMASGERDKARWIRPAFD